MEKRHRELIVSNRVKLVREMFTDRIVSKMRGGLLNESDIEDITSEESAREKAEALLSILPRKGPKAFVAFVKALQEVQGYLSEPFLEEAGLPDIKEGRQSDLISVMTSLKLRLSLGCLDDSRLL